MSDSPDTSNGAPAGESKEEMEARLRRLESALAAMQDTKLMEERLLQRVIDKIDHQPPPPAALAPPQPAPQIPAEMLVQAGRAILPGALNAVSSGIAAATHPRNVGLHQTPSLLSPKSWILLDLILELRTCGMMFLDPRFQPGWSVKLIPVTCFFLILINYILFGGLLHLLDIPLIILSYKTLTREANRYRAEVASLPPGK